MFADQSLHRAFIPALPLALHRSQAYVIEALRIFAANRAEQLHRAERRIRAQ